MKRYIYMGICIALAIVLGILEGMLPAPTTVPGIKLGIANLVVLFVLYRMGAKEAITVSVCRGLFNVVLFSASSGIYSIAGGLVSVIIMVLLRKHLHRVTVSICGSVGHIFGQLVIAALIVGVGPIAYYAPILMASAIICGVVIGILGDILIRRVWIDTV